MQNSLCVRLLTGNKNSKKYIASEFCQFLLIACETLCVVLRRGHSLRVFGKKVLEKGSSYNNDVVTGEWRKLRDG